MDLTTFFIGLVLGLALGWLAQMLYARKLGSDQQLSKQLQDLQQAHQNYQEQVSEHFEQTSSLIEQLNSSYQAVNLHLTQGMEQLASQDYKLTKLRANELDLSLDSQKLDEDKPRDYADKHPDQPGTLSSQYGHHS